MYVHDNRKNVTIYDDHNFFSGKYAVLVWNFVPENLSEPWRGFVVIGNGINQLGLAVICKDLDTTFIHGWTQLQFNQ